MISDPAGPDERPTRIRHLVVFVSMLMAVLLYLDRFCVSFAADYIREDLGLTQRDMSWFLSAFFWSYALAQVPSGWLSDRYGARIMLVVYVLSWSFFTAMIGAVWSLALLVLMRLASGLGQAGAYPTSASVVSKWVPFASRGTASSIIAFGGRCGGALAPLLTAWLMVIFVPLDVPADLSAETILNGPRLAAKIAPQKDVAGQGDALPSKSGSRGDASADKATLPGAAGKRVWKLLTESQPPRSLKPVRAAATGYRSLERRRRQAVRRGDETGRREAAALELLLREHDTAELRSALAGALNRLLDKPDLYDETAFRGANLPREAITLLKRKNAGETLSETELRRFNRLLLEAAFPEEIGKLYVHGWRPVMFVYGIAGIVVAGLIWLCFRNRPEEHPWCNRAEWDLIAAGRPSTAPSPHGRPGMVPLVRLVRSGSMWFVCLMQVGTNIGWVFLVTWLPRYLLEVHRVPIIERGVMAMVPVLVGIGGMLCGGRLTDFLVARAGLRWGRRLPMMITRFSAALGYGLCLWFSTFAAGSPLASAWAFTLAFALVALSTDMGTASVWAFKQDVGGRYVGSILGWGNMWGNLGAAVAPPMIYDMVLGEQPGVSEWNTMFAVCLGAFVLAGLCALGVDATVPIAPPDEEHKQ